MIVAVILIAMVLFLALTLLLVTKPEDSARLNRILFVVLTVMGLVSYGYGFLTITGDHLLSVVRAIIAVVRMFTGDPDVGELSEVPLLQSSWMQLLLWLVHLLALYTTVSVAANVLGAKALRKLRLRLNGKQPLNLIYGVSRQTQELGRGLLQQNMGAVVFVGGSEDAADGIFEAGGLLRSDDSALQADGQFLRSIGANRKGRRITLYAMADTYSDSLRYARQLLEAMHSCGIQPEQTGLVIRARENGAVTSMQVLGDNYGYGSVTVVQETGLAARTLIQQYPPCDHLAFDANGRAAENFEALIVGFGQVGQAVLQQLVMNAQFEGSTFRAAVFAPDCDGVKGYFAKRYPQVLKQYDIRFFAQDARSEQMYDYLAERADRIKYLAICTGTDKMNDEIAEDLTDYLQSIGVRLPAYLCGHQGVKKFDPDDRTVSTHSLYCPQVLSMERMDGLAMLVNDQYQHDRTKTPLQHWLQCDYFSRMSCRAMADFIPAMLKMAGKTRQQVRESGWELTAAQVDTMSRTEHLRWCAFHYCMGFAPMEEAEYAQREATYLRQRAAGEPPIRVGKNMEKRTHACLISWEALVELSHRETRVTGKPVDYQRMDTDNVMLIPALLRHDQ